MTDNILTETEVTEIEEPFDLITALQYLKDNDEFIRYKSATKDMYIYKDTQKRPTIVNGKRKLVTVETIRAISRWGSNEVSFNIENLLDENFYIMKFDEEGEPIWD